MKPTLGSQRGASLLLILMVTGVVSIGFYFLANQIIQQKRQAALNGSNLQFRLALNSVMDYALFGLKERWCYSDSMMPDSPCDLNHTGSVERLLMPPEQEAFIRDLASRGLYGGGLPTGKIALPLIERHVNLANLTTNHPLTKILSILQAGGVKGIYFKLERDRSTLIPQLGNEVHLLATLSLTEDAGSSTPMKWNGADLTLSSVLVTSPRELGAFALIVPGSLHLDKTYNDTVPQGDIALHRFNGINEVGGSSGLVFQSPVFVNHDLYLPYVAGVDGRQKSGQAYAAVTFAEPVFLGGGQIYENGLPYQPQTAGGMNDDRWSQNKLFGGFLKGVEIDSTRDAGLEYLGKIQAGTPPDNSMLQQCIQLNLTKADRSKISNSQLISQPLTALGTNTTYRLGFSDMNEFEDQLSPLRPIDTSQWKGTANRSLLGKAIAPIVSVEIDLNGQRVAAQMPRDSQLSAAVTLVSVNLPQLQSSLAGAQQNVVNLKKDLQDLQTQEASAETDLAANRDDETLKKKVQSLKDAVSQKNNDLTAANQKVTGLLAQVQTAQDLQNNPPSVVVTTKTVDIGINPQPHLVDVQIEIKNSQNFKDQNGQAVVPSVGVQAYDPTFYNSAPLGAPNAKLKAYFNYEMRSGVDMTAPNGMSPSMGTGTPQAWTVSKVDMGTLEQKCNTQLVATSGQSFGAADWDYSFAPSARHSWNFAGSTPNQIYVDPLITEFVFDGTNALPGNATFQVRSVVGTCRIKSTAQFVTGFLSCDQLIIENRASPLRIIGTIIAGGARIDPSAFRAGIRWSSIYHPQAVADLRAAGVLRTRSGAACGISPTPIWHPIPSLKEVADRYACNTVSLRAKADPFQWTAVDPDCGLLPGAASTTCKHRVLRYFVLEQSREVNL